MSANAETQNPASRVVVITGGGQGIGRALAHGFSREGFRVVVCDQNAETAAGVVDEIVATGGVATAIQADVSDRASSRRMAEHATQHFGRIDVLINNAAMKASARRKFWEIEEAEWDRLMAVNVKGVWLSMCSVLPAMRAQGAGTIINMSSAVFNAGGIDYLHYAASKAAIIGITRSAARELGDFDIRVNCILPGYVRTGAPRANFQQSETQQAERVKARIIKRPAEPEDVVGVALFLASDRAGYMTGQSVNIDGGRTFI